jgi:hypothetical protein
MGMGTPNVREQLVAELDHLTDEQVALLLHYAQDLHGKPASDEMEADVGELDNPLMGFFSGPPDLAETSQEVLRREFGLRKLRDDE